MQDIGSWPAWLQWIVAFGALIGSAVAAAIGARVARSKPPSSTDNDLLEARATIRDNVLRHDFEQVVSASRKSFYELFGRLEERVRKLEQEVSVLRSRRRPRGDDD